MSDTSERVGAVDGDALLKAVEESQLGETVKSVMRAWIKDRRFALKPEASQDGKWEKLKEKLNEGGLYSRQGVLDLIAELEDAE